MGILGLKITGKKKRTDKYEMFYFTVGGNTYSFRDKNTKGTYDLWQVTGNEEQHCYAGHSDDIKIEYHIKNRRWIPIERPANLKN